MPQSEMRILPKLPWAQPGKSTSAGPMNADVGKGIFDLPGPFDGGKTFSQAININSDAALQPAGHAFQSVTVDRKGQIYITWIDERNKKPPGPGSGDLDDHID